MAKKYAEAGIYESKLYKVMARLGIDEKDISYNFDRFGGWVEFRYKGEPYRFDHSVESAKAHGVAISYRSDAFAQLVIALEDLTRISERGIYTFQRWISGMKYLPPVVEVPSCFKSLVFVEIPLSTEEVKDRYRGLAKEFHPDTGGNPEDFARLKAASEQCLRYFEVVKS